MSLCPAGRRYSRCPLSVSRIALRHLLLAGLEDVVIYDKTFERYERTREGK